MDESNEPKDLPLEVTPTEQIMRAEVNQQIETALAHPRDLRKFMKRAETMISIDEETAASCLYKLRRKDKNEPGGYKIIEGESIRMAEIVASTYGNLRSAVQITGHTPTRVTVRAACHDLESNNLVAVEKQARTTYSDGSPYNDDLAILTTNALVSKALRDAIFRVVPKALVKPLKEIAKRVALGDGEIFVERRQRAVDWATKTRKVPLDRVLNALGVPSVENMTVEHLEVLTGLKNAIMDGDQSVEEAFPPIDEIPGAEMGGMQSPKTHPAKAKDEPAPPKSEPTAETAKPRKKPEPKPEPKAEPKPEPAPAAAAPAEPQPAPAPTPEPAPESKVEPVKDVPAEPPPTAQEASGLSENQRTLQHELESRGFSFNEFVEWGKASLFKTGPKPVSWAQIPDDRAKFYLSAMKGIVSALSTWKTKASAKK